MKPMGARKGFFESSKARAVVHVPNEEMAQVLYHHLPLGVPIKTPRAYGMVN